MKNKVPLVKDSLTTQQRISKMRQHERMRNTRGLSAEIETIILRSKRNPDEVV
jgi:hypothetical protein